MWSRLEDGCCKCLQYAPKGHNIRVRCPTLGRMNPSKIANIELQNYKLTASLTQSIVAQDTARPKKTPKNKKKVIEAKETKQKAKS